MSKMLSISKENMYFLLMGMFVFSTFGTIIIRVLLNVQMSLNEVLIIPFLVILRDRIKGCSLHGNFMTVFFCTLFFVMLALVVGSFAPYEIMSNARAWFYLYIGYVVFKYNTSISSDNLLYASLGMIIAWFFAALYNIFYVIPNLTAEEFSSNAITANGVMIGIPMFFSLAIMRNRKILFLLGTILFIFISLFGGQRRVIVVGIVSVVVSFLLSGRSTSKLIRNMLIGLCILMFLILILPIAENYISEINPVLYHRVFVRTRLLLEGGADASQDHYRIQNILIFLNSFWDYIIPRGYVSLNTMNVKGTGIFNDLPIVELCWIYSWPVAFLIIARFLRVLFRNYRKYIKVGNEENALSVTCLVIMSMLLFLEGTYLNYPFSAFVTGAMLGRAVRNIQPCQVIR